MKMYACCNAGGSATTEVDFCFVAPAVAEKFSNHSICGTGNKNVQGVTIEGGCVHNLNTIVQKSIGDDAGTLKGVFSKTTEDDVRYITGANSVLVNGAPIVRVTSVTEHNRKNKAPGSHTVPSQLVVIVHSA